MVQELVQIAMHNFGGTIPAIDDYNAGGGMKFATWNPADSTMSLTKGLVPSTH